MDQQLAASHPQAAIDSAASGCVMSAEQRRQHAKRIFMT
jgi:hypothetical protein